MLLTVKWWMVVEPAASQAHVLTPELILLLYIRYWLRIEPLLFTAQCSWFLVLSSESHLFKMGFQKDGCKQFQFWGHDTWVTTSITVNLLPSSDYSDFDPDSSLGFLPLVFVPVRISFLICFLRIEHWFFFPQNCSLPYNSVLASKLLPSLGCHLYISELPPTPYHTQITPAPSWPIVTLGLEWICFLPKAEQTVYLY